MKRNQPDTVHNFESWRHYVTAYTEPEQWSTRILVNKRNLISGWMYNITVDTAEISEVTRPGLWELTYFGQYWPTYAEACSELQTTSCIC